PARWLEPEGRHAQPEGGNRERHARRRSLGRRAGCVEVSAADHLTGLVDVGGLASGIAWGREYRHHAILPQERARLTVGGEADPNDLTAIVDGERGRSPTAQVPEVLDRAVRPEDRMRGAVVAVAAADDLARTVDVPRDAELVPGKTAEVRHRSALPHERVHRVGGILALADDETRIADIMCGAAGTAERPEVRHDAVVP